MSDREELAALRRMAELEAKASSLPVGVVGTPSRVNQIPDLENTLDPQRNYVSPRVEPTPDRTGVFNNIMGGIAEPITHMATSFAAKPVSEVMGMAAMLKDKLSGGTGEDASRFKQEIQDKLTYKPRTEAGASPYNPLNAVPNAIGQAVSYVGNNLSDKLGAGESEDQASWRGRLGAGLREGVAQGVGIAGVKYIPKAVESFGNGMQSGANKLMQNALKPTPKQIMSGTPKIAADELLARGINPNTSGVVELQGLIDNLHGQVESKIANSNGVVSVSDVTSEMMNPRSKFMKQVDPHSDLSAIDNVQTGFENHPAIVGNDIPIQLANELKKGTYQALKGKYGEAGSAATEAQKALARGLRKQIEKLEPDVIPLNAEQQALMKTLELSERKSAMELAKDPAQLTGMMSSPAAWAAYTANKSSMFKAVLAQMIDSLGKAANSGKNIPALATLPQQNN